MFFDNVLVLLLLMSEPDILGTSIEFTLNTNILLKNFQTIYFTGETCVNY